MNSKKPIDFETFMRFLNKIKNKEYTYFTLHTDLDEYSMGLEFYYNHYFDKSHIGPIWKINNNNSTFFGIIELTEKGENIYKRLNILKIINKI